MTRLMVIAASAAFLGLSSMSDAGAFELTSPELKEGDTLANEHVYNGFGCTGANRSPELAWKDAPAGTKSFVLTVYDPDAPTGSGWWHWVVYNIPATTKGLAAGAGAPEGSGLPPGSVQGRTDFGTAGYGGPCPPEGTKHRYVFTLHALKVDKLDLPPDASAAMVGFMTNANSLGSATLSLAYGR